MHFVRRNAPSNEYDTVQSLSAMSPTLRSIQAAEPSSTTKVTSPLTVAKMAGYQDLALVLSTCPEVASFKTFKKLNLEILLLQQAELCHTQFDIEVLRGRISNSSTLSWEDMRNAEKQSATYELQKQLLEAQKKLAVYCEYNQRC